MLVLSRKMEESIIIDNNIKIKIVGLEKGSVKLGIEAPKNISVFREELLSDIEKLNKEASKTTSISSLNILSNFFKK